MYKRQGDKQTFDYAETLAEPIQRFADVLEKELKISKQDVRINENAENDYI